MEDQLKKLVHLEEQIKLLQGEIQNVKHNKPDEENEELMKVVTENSKLKHRLSILNNAISNEKKSTKTDPITGVISIMDYLNDMFEDACKTAYPMIKNPLIVICYPSSTNLKYGDYQCNTALSLCNMLKQQNIKQSPKDVAANILSNLRPSSLITKTDISGAGFINITIDKFYVQNAVSTILQKGVQPPATKKQKVVVDFSSPNIAKEMHVGHLRSTIIGDSICRLLEYLGHNVLRINHTGDWGTQFGMLIAHLEDRFPNFKNESPPISDLQAFYKESKSRFDTEEDFKKRAYKNVVKLQGGDKDSLKAWNLICDVSRKEFQVIYDRLDIKIQERGESFYQSRMESLVKEFQTKGYLIDDDGRKIMWGVEGPDYGGVPLTVVKSDGGFTYDTSDMATIKNRIEEEKGDWLIYVTDAGQATHFKIIFSCAERVGILDRSKVRIDHVGFGVVLGEDGKKFKTRSGDTVKLSDLLDEGIKRSMQKLVEKDRIGVLTPEEVDKVQKNVAYACIKYSDLSKNRTNEYLFSFDKMLEDKGNTAVYLLYAYTRIRSIARNCGEEFIKNLTKTIQETQIELEHEKELRLGKVLCQYPDVLTKIIKELHMHYLCDYVYDVCCAFTEFYDNCYCIQKNKEGVIERIIVSRVLLCEATANVMDQCFDILGIKTVQKI